MSTLIILPLQLVYLFVYSAFFKITDSFGESLLLLSVFTFLIVSLLENYASNVEQKEKLITSILTPQIEAIKSKFKGKERHQKIRSLYQRYGYNPIYAIRSATGVLLQLPFLFGAYFMLSNLPILENQSFGFLSDLSKPDNLLFGINLLPILMFTISAINGYLSTDCWDRARKQSLFISLLFLVLLYTAPSALLVYWTTNNVFYLTKTLIKRCYHSSFKLPITFISLFLGSFLLILLFISLSSLSLFINNPQDYTSNFWTFLDHYSISGFYIASVICVICVLLGITAHFIYDICLKRKNTFLDYFNRLVLLIFCLILSALIQNAVLNENVAVLDGRQTVAMWGIKGIFSLLLWGSLIVLPQIFFHKLKSLTITITLLLSLTMLVDFSLSNGEDFHKLLETKAPSNKRLVVDYDSAFEFSSTNRNVVVLLSDTFSGTVAREIFKEPEYRKMFEGFALLTDYSAAFPTTAASVAALLSGELYDNSIPLRDFYTKTKSLTLQNSLKTKGFRTSLAKEGKLFTYKSKDLFDNIRIIQKTPVLNIQEKQQTFEAVTFKFAPTQLKLSNWDNFVFQITNASGKATKSSPSTTWDFDFIKNSETKFISIENIPGLVLYAHLHGVHHPYNVKSDLSLGKTSEIEQSKASLKSMHALISKMKENGIFDNSVFLITADHPDTPYKEKSIIGLLHIPGQKGEMIERATPGAINHMKNLVLAAATSSQNLSVGALTDKFSPSSRIFRNYAWDDGWTKSFLPSMTEYEIKGPSYDKDNYHRTGSKLLPGLKAIAIETELKFPRDLDLVPNSFASSFKISKNGMIATEKNHPWQNVYSFLINPPKGKIFSLSLEIESLSGEKYYKKKIITSKALCEDFIPFGHSIVSLKVALLKDGDVMYFGNPSSLPEPNYLSGWHAAETTHTWSADNHTSFSLNFEPEYWSLKFNLFPFRTNEQPTRKVLVYINQKLVTTVMLEKTTEISLSLNPTDFKQDDSAQIHIVDQGKLLSPSETFGTSDVRKLGIGISDIKIQKM